MIRGARSTRTLVAVVVALASVAAGVWVAASGPAAAAATSTPVMAQARVAPAALAGWFRSKGKTSSATVSIDVLAELFVDEGADEGVAGDLAFAQSIVETGYFGFSTRVPARFNNFSGLGAVDGGTGAASFPDARTGVRAQIQHLRAYADPTATTAALSHAVVDPRFSLVWPKGKAPTWEQFGNGNWATDPDYAGKVLGIYAQIVAWAADHPTSPTTTTAPPPVADPRWAPFASADAVVAWAHRDLLAREATAGERTAASDTLEGGGLDAPGYLAALIAGEGADHAEPVARLYLSALGRLPDRSGLQYWTRRHAAGVRLVRLAEQFLTSSEFQRRYGDPTDIGFVELLYRNVLGRPSDPAGADYWSRRITAGATDRVGLLVQFSESSEHIRASAPTVEASIVYLGMVLRAPDPSVLSWWTTKRDGGSPLAVLTGLVWRSTAFQDRFAA